MFNAYVSALVIFHLLFLCSKAEDTLTLHPYFLSFIALVSQVKVILPPSAKYVGCLQTVNRLVKANYVYLFAVQKSLCFHTEQTTEVCYCCISTCK